MALINHIDALTTKHQHLEQMIREELLRPVPDFVALAGLKKNKLLVKEELQKCIHDLPHAGSA